MKMKKKKNEELEKEKTSELGHNSKTTKQQ